MTYLVHHGDAFGPDVDPRRPLSAAGRAGVQRLAEEAARRGVKPEAVWHSGKLRARQTAEAYWKACNPLATLSAERGLQPDDPPAWIKDRLTGETRHVMIVGHMPHLVRLLRLLTGDPVASPRTFPLHGIVELEPDGEGWRERWRSGS